ncbi:hypothetical protein AM500_19480 [Bacillus sp. FJAT-18017]|nr:hypothetical protein AM500_19480 [Bacillus sp. FJAT-18017]
MLICRLESGHREDDYLEAPFEFVLKWIAYISLAFLVFTVLWEIFAFVWIVVLQKRDYDRYLFWIKPKPKRRSKKKKRARVR